MSPEALAGLAGRRTGRFPDARVSHFTDLEARLGEGYAPVLELPEEQLAWDSFLLFGPGVKWGEAPPKPTFWMHQLSRGPPTLRLDAARFAAEVGKLLAALEESQP
ncbi:MAG: hypothetical protein L0212_08365 [Acidobacteria bacterium]|nr:hypothetical protein [Acidobacteriota bacterium]